MKIYDIVYRLAIHEDRAEVLQFLRDHYFPYEPLHCFVKSNSPGQDSQQYDEDYTLRCLEKPNRFCLLAINGNQIVGIYTCSAKSSDEEQKILNEASQIPSSTQFAKILVIRATVERDCNVFQKYKCDRIMHGNDLAVHTDFRGNGIGLKLYDMSIQIAKALGYQLFTSRCSSVYSARLSERLGMECIHIFKMEEYREPGSDEQVIFPTENQKYIRTFAKMLI